MKRFTSALLLVLLATLAFSQPVEKSGTSQKPPTQADMAKLLEQEMIGMSDEEKTEMRKLMKGVMPEMAKKPGNTKTTFTNNKKLVPAKNAALINSVSRKPLTETDITLNAAMLYNKLMAKIPSSEKALLTRVISKANTGSLLMEAGIIAFLQGHNRVAIGLSLKAVQAEPKNVIYQNNLAAILSQSGYPDKAIPYLRKLSTQFPSNSTVLHNLGYAWLQLGEVDTARKYFRSAATHNPNNAETSICLGVIEELKGDPKKAAEHYVDAFEEAPNPFTESLAKNVKAEKQLEKIDFENLKNRIASYDYFKNNWITIPTLADDVLHFEANMKIKNGYTKMFTALEAKIESVIEASMEELNALADKGISEFAREMMKENQNGLSMMSMPAVYIQKIMMAYISKWQEAYVAEHQELMEGIQQKKVIMTRYENNDKCPDYNRKNNEFLRYANPLIRNFHTKKIEEAREWINVFCTWSWYITGNPKNTVLTLCVTWTSFLVKMYESAIADQFAIAKSCTTQNGDGIADIPAPAIPNFSCPAVVSIPIGLEELRLSADAVNFDDNSWGLRKAAGGNDHNFTLTHGIDKNYISEPGLYGNPSTKVGNGSMTPPGLDINDLTPLPKIVDDLAPLNPALLDAQKKRSKENFRNAALTKQLLNELFKPECPGKLPERKKRKDRFEIGVGKLELLEWNEDYNAWVNEQGELMYDKNGKPFENLEVTLGELEIVEWREDYNAWVNEKGELMYDKDGKRIANIVVEAGELEFEDIETSGIQTVITNGLEVAGTVGNFIKGLFD